jgi:hypothetical protein
MGAWGLHGFDNDDALDWVWLLEDDESGDLPRATLARIAEAPADEHLEAPDCATAIASAEVLAAARGRPGPDVPPEVTAWIDRHGARIRPEVEELAGRAVARIRDSSELRELWKDGPQFHRWLGLIAVLESRLDRPGELMKQITMTHQTWGALTRYGVTDGTMLRLDFFYEPAPEGAARALAAFLQQETDYEVRVESSGGKLRRKSWHVLGTTQPVEVSVGLLIEWTTWMVVAGEEHGPCGFDGWGAPLPGR